ncbi:DMT family transporter [Microbispora sp. H11081]|uniref:DMT family transporter n=1 Tax=Microbispora sp. H11081 TaxID=2729107 RepID=UPI001B8BF5B7|nr:DMT family transporter [Microbispora sp. H11081]
MSTADPVPRGVTDHAAEGSCAMILTVVLGLTGAAFLGLGWVAQQHVAYTEPLGEMLRFRLLLDLARKPIWLAGIASMIGGQVLGGLALREADVASVTPLLATNLIFALAAAALIYQERLGAAEWLGAVLVSGGVVAFLLAGRPHGGGAPASDTVIWASVLAVAGVAAGLVTVALRAPLQVKAMLLAGAAGALYGLQDALTRGALLTLARGPAALFTSWLPYLLPIVAATGILLNQSAFDAAPLRVSLPATTATEPIIGILLGVAIFGERLRVDPPALAGTVAGLVALVAGIVILGRSPFLAKSEQGRAPPDD